MGLRRARRRNHAPQPKPTHRLMFTVLVNGTPSGDDHTDPIDALTLAMTIAGDHPAARVQVEVWRTEIQEAGA